MAAKIFATYSLKKGKPLGPYGAFFYGLGGQPLWGQQKASKLEEAAGHIADFTFPFGMLFLLALAACNWNGCAETYFHSPGIAEISRLHKPVRVEQHRGCLITSQAANSPRICKGYASRLWRPLQIHRMNGAICA